VRNLRACSARGSRLAFTARSRKSNTDIKLSLPTKVSAQSNGCPCHPARQVSRHILAHQRFIHTPSHSFDDLACRFERPDARNRWDAPLFTVRPCMDLLAPPPESSRPAQPPLQVLAPPQVELEPPQQPPSLQQQQQHRAAQEGYAPQPSVHSACPPSQGHTPAHHSVQGPPQAAGVCCHTCGLPQEAAGATVACMEAAADKRAPLADRGVQRGGQRWAGRYCSPAQGGTLGCVLRQTWALFMDVACTALEQLCCLCKAKTRARMSAHAHAHAHIHTRMHTCTHPYTHAPTCVYS